MLAYLLPASFIAWVHETVKARVERWAGLTDRKLDLMEAELADRQAFAGITIPVKAIETPPAPVNRIESTNGRRKAKA